jgi:glycosyltransferase involved in cell wall biosynthesis
MVPSIPVPTQEPTIALDARQCVGNYRGMGRFARNLMAALDRPFLALLARGQSAKGLCPRAVCRGTRLFPAWEQFVLPRFCRELGVDVLICPYNTAPLRLPDRVKLVLVVHDLIFMEPFGRLAPARSLYQNVGRVYRRLVVPRVVHRADVLVTCSQYTKGLLVARFGLRGDSIVVMPSASTDVLGDCPNFRAAKMGLSPSAPSSDDPHSRTPYVLFPGGDAPSKNARRAVLAFAGLCRREPGLPHKLVVLGIPPRSHARFARLAGRAGVGERVELMPFVPAARLAALYRRADAVFFPSLYEGFGIPALEAMAAGTPLVCSSRTSLPEIAGRAALYIDPLSVEQMADGLARVLRDASLRARLVREGRDQCRRFRPEVLRECAERVWQQVLPISVRKAA